MVVPVVVASSTVACGGRRRRWKSPVCYWFELAAAVGALVGAGEEACVVGKFTVMTRGVLGGWFASNGRERERLTGNGEEDGE